MYSQLSSSESQQNSDSLLHFTAQQSLWKGSFAKYDIKTKTIQTPEFAGFYLTIYEKKTKTNSPQVNCW